MTLRIMQPIVIDSGNIASSNVALEAEWAAGTYQLGDQARVGERLYEVSVETTTEEPSETATEWFDAGPANRFAAFDLQFGSDQFRVVETTTTNADSITYTLTALTEVTGIALFGLNAESVQIVATVSTTGDAANIDVPLEDGTQYNGSMWRWLFLPQSIPRKYLNFDLDIPAGATLEITINQLGGTAEVGTIALGTFAEHGIVTVGTSRSLKSRSVKRTEGALTSLLRRTPSARVNYSVVIQDYKTQFFWQTIDDIDGLGAVFSAQDTHAEFAVYGFVNSAQTTAEGNGISKVSVEVESL